MAHVLIVDKDEAIQNAFRQYFAGTGVSVASAASFDEAGAQVSAADLILTDDFGDAADPEQAAIVRARNFSTLAPVICMSRARLKPEMIKNLGYAGLLAKPFKGPQVKEVIDRWLPLAA